jgi:hypothetical protein
VADLDLKDGLARFGYVPNWGWAFILLGIGGLIDALYDFKDKKGS